MNDDEARKRGLVVETEAYLKGFRSSRDDTNPYPKDTQEFTDWEDGFRMMDWLEYSSDYTCIWTNDGPTVLKDD